MPSGWRLRFQGVQWNRYLAQDSEFRGKKTNNEAAICGLILGLHRALAGGSLHYPSAATRNLLLSTSLGARAGCTTRGVLIPSAPSWTGPFA